MKRKLPPVTNRYLGPDMAEKTLTQDDTGFSVWATYEDQVVRVSRLRTHEVPGSKWVEFAVAPHAILLTGQRLYPHPQFANLTIRCEWSDFLRLTRWRKSVEGFPRAEQALIARLQYTNKSTAAMPLQLVAVDHPIRKTGKNTK